MFIYDFDKIGLRFWDFDRSLKIGRDFQPDNGLREEFFMVFLSRVCIFNN